MNRGIEYCQKQTARVVARIIVDPQGHNFSHMIALQVLCLGSCIHAGEV